MKQHRNLPFFVPHAGCPHCCVFCSQVKITGHCAEKDSKTEIRELRDMLDSATGDFKESQIGFFGGSFTAIEKARMVALLETANEYIQNGTAADIRISTRPDCINEEILNLLAKYNVKNIELGIQSTDNAVLNACERGHTADRSFASAKLVVEKGFVFGGQMMIGLPKSTLESEIQTAKDIVAMGAKEARIYPTVVFEGTKLYDMAEKGEYTPLDLEDAVNRTAKCYKIFLDAGVKVLRIGLHASENLAKAPMGANHPSMGELVKSRVYTDVIAERAGNCRDKILTVKIRKEDISKLRGYNSAAINRLKALTKASDIEIIPCVLPEFQPLIEVRSF